MGGQVFLPRTSSKIPDCGRGWTCLLGFPGLICWLLFILYQLFDQPAFHHTVLKHRSACYDFPESCRLAAPFIFDSVYSLLKQWPNTYASNGHSLVPAIVPTNVQLYHAGSGPGPPKKPTFFAFDAEMSIGIYGSVGAPVLHTMTTTRQLRAIYFDGQSASLTTMGTLDSQIALLRGKVPLNPTEDLIYDEAQRALELCDFLEDLKMDGVVRMNAGFEIMLCDYNKSRLRELYVINVTVPGNEARERDLSLPRDPNRTPPLGFGNTFAEQNGWEWIRSGTWHYGNSMSGGSSLLEKRVRLDLCGMVTFYDPRLRSISGSHRSGVRDTDLYQNGWGLRRGHRLLGVSREDVNTVRRWLKEATRAQARGNFRVKLRTEEASCSLTDWQALTEIIVDQHGSRAREIALTLEQNPVPAEDAKKIIKHVHELSHAIIYPYLEYPSVAGLPALAVKERTISRCASAYTGHIDLDTLKEFEVILKESIEIVMEKLCTWEWELFDWSDRHTTNHMQWHLDTNTSTGVFEEVMHFRNKTSSMMNWLGWNLWRDCERLCSWAELCYIPMWPLIYSPGKHQGGIYAGSNLTDGEMFDFWKPKCLNRAEFDRGGGRAREPSHQLPDVPYNASNEGGVS